MHVVGRGDGDAVQPLAFLVKHLAPIGIALGIGPFFRGSAEAATGAFLGVACRARGIDIAERDDARRTVLRCLGNIAPAFAADADGSDVGLIVGRGLEQPGGEDRDRRHCGGGASEKFAAGKRLDVGFHRRGLSILADATRRHIIVYKLLARCQTVRI